jgi:hypothetical protein
VGSSNFNFADEMMMENNNYQAQDETDNGYYGDHNLI